ncbi:acyltransferase family protein [Simiduia litorea]|uniref:acyltransferase family protein n=1 Tax=Simiduia litorea TaxID=1435348 RepID=UPI0036F33E66
MERRYDLDWLRVLAFALLIFYHTGMMYVSWDWHISSEFQSESLKLAMLLVNPWRLPLLFFISGCALYFAQQRYPLSRLLNLRSQRLLIPLVFGILVIVPPQLFFEMRQAGEATGHYGQFWQAYLTPNDPLFSRHRTPLFGQMTWNHLWFIPYLWCYSVLILGLRQLLILPSKWLGQLPLALLLLIPGSLLACYGFWLRPQFPSTHALLGDWYNHATYLTVFALGYGFAACDAVWLKLKGKHWPLLIMALSGYAILMWEDSLPENTGLGETVEYWGDIVFTWFYYCTLWCWILALCALAMRFLNHNSRALRYANGAVYPYYILHQTITVSIGYYLVEAQWGPIMEPLGVLAITFLGCAVGYEIIARIHLLRWLFGLAPKVIPAPKKQTQPAIGNT